MKLTRGLFLVVFILFLSSCTTTSESVSYYSLNLATGDSTQTILAKNHLSLPQVAIEPIHLSSFLRQEGLVMQLGKHQIYSANYHRWGEPLEEAISKQLIHQLNKQSKNFHFVRADHQWNKNIHFNLRLEFENFHATDNSTTISSGQYWFYDQTKQIKLNAKFNISNTLQKDGYLHSVEKLKQSLNELSVQIIKTLGDSKA